MKKIWLSILALILIAWIIYAGYFFLEEEKLKRIFISNKNDNSKLKYELSVLVDDLGKRFKGLIFMSFFYLLFVLYIFHVLI